MTTDIMWVLQDQRKTKFSAVRDYRNNCAVCNQKFEQNEAIVESSYRSETATMEATTHPNCKFSPAGE